MMKPKEWLVAQGHLKEAGRGRMSREHIALIQAAVASGVEIEGYSTPKPAPVKAVEPKPEKVESTGIVDVPETVRHEADWQAFVDNREVGMRTVCNGCGNSLTHCYEKFSKVWIDHTREGVVVFKQRTTPRKRWW
jgi:hypothetical protein